MQKFNSELEEIATALGTFRQDRRQSPSAMHAETELARKLKEAQAERDYWDRCAR